MLNFLNNYTRVMKENVLILGRYILKNLGVKGHNVCNFFSSGSAKIICICM